MNYSFFNPKVSEFANLPPEMLNSQPIFSITTIYFSKTHLSLNLPVHENAQSTESLDNKDQVKYNHGTNTEPLFGVLSLFLKQLPTTFLSLNAT